MIKAWILNKKTAIFKWLWKHKKNIATVILIIGLLITIGILNCQKTYWKKQAPKFNRIENKYSM